MANNVSTLTNTLKCTSESVVSSLLNSSDVMNVVKQELIGVVETYKAASSYVQSLRSFDHVTRVNVSMVTRRFRDTARRLKEDFLRARGQLTSLKTYAHRLLAAILVLHLLFSAGRYLHAYVTALDFDNVYVTPRLRRLAAERGVPLTAGQLRDGVDATGYRLSRREMWECVPPLVLVTLHLLLCVVLVALDFLVYRVVSAGRPWLLDIPDTNITLSVNYKIHVCVPGVCLVANCCSDGLVFNRTYRWPVHMGSAVCRTSALPSAPDRGVLLLLTLLFMLSYVLAVLQVYVRRVRRAVAASFFPRQEERRNDFLLRKLLAKQSGRVFTIATADTASSGTERTTRQQQTHAYPPLRLQLPQHPNKQKHIRM
ncbi:osteoclast stimulatory transmembrane protein [Sardina pilchardus]|uniref:osteoclast stimulatory transmembrane protein n=1 Tax=Sardina pilchardus TaxID=27697 RepID=UPI002E13322A